MNNEQHQPMMLDSDLLQTIDRLRKENAELNSMVHGTMKAEIIRANMMIGKLVEDSERLAEWIKSMIQFVPRDKDIEAQVYLGQHAKLIAKVK